MIPAMRGQVAIGLFAALLAVAWALMIAAPHRAGQASFLDPVDSFLLNLRFTTFGAGSAETPVVIVAIDDAMLAAANPLGQGRANLAALVDAIAAKGAAVVALDILLTDAHDPQNDRELARALGAVPSVIAAAGRISPNMAVNTLPSLSEILQPQSQFASAAEIGIVNISTDHSGVPRHIPIVFVTDGGVQPSLSAQAASLFLAAPLQLASDTLTLGPHSISLDLGFQMPLRLLGPEGTITTIPALDVMASASDIDLNGKLVVIGVTATGLGDRFPTPFDPTLPGVEVMATAMSQMVGGDGLRRDGAIRQFDMVSASVLAAICVLIVIALPLSLGLSIATGLILLWLGVTWIAFSAGLWLNAALPLAAAGPPLFASALLRYAQEKRLAATADRAVTELKKFQSPMLANRIAEDPEFLSHPQQQELIVCFVDLSGFTQLSQDLGAERSETFLKRFHAELADIAQEHDGMVLNFMGDGALLVFGVFSTTETTADVALNAAFKMVERTRNLGVSEGFADPLGARVGLHFGQVILSRMGGAEHQQLTITGDTVNLCSRLLEIAKNCKTHLTATEDFLIRLASPPPRPADLSTTEPVRGRSGEVRLSHWRF